MHFNGKTNTKISRHYFTWRSAYSRSRFNGFFILAVYISALLFIFASPFIVFRAAAWMSSAHGCVPLPVSRHNDYSITFISRHLRDGRLAISHAHTARALTYSGTCEALAWPIFEIRR